jgi:hypothetical protein
MGKLIWLGAFGGCIRDVMRPVDLLFRDLESVVRLFRITGWMPKLVMWGGGRVVSTTSFYGSGFTHQSALLAEADIDGKIITFCPFG